MADHPHHDDSLNPHARGHQEDRIHFGAIGLFTVGLVVIVGLVFVVLAALMARFNQADARRFEQRPASFALQDADLYPGPRLQEAPPRDMEAMRKQVNQRLDSYGWVDQNAGVTHIPIDRALAITAEKGLPARSSETGGPSE